MKILDVYDKNTGSNLTCYNKRVFKVMDNFFANYPLEYRENYDRNLETLKIFRVDEFNNNLFDGGYAEANNIVFFLTNYSLCHEFMHVASYDSKNDISSIERFKPCIEGALIEGMTEYLAMKALGLNAPSTYEFETFCVSMLSSIDGLFKPYFIPNHEEFVSLFAREKDIYSLMYSLDYYEDVNNSLIGGEDRIIDNNSMIRCIRDIFRILLNIECLYENDPYNLQLYKEKMMDLVRSREISLVLSLYYKNYENFVYNEVKKRIKV